MKKEPFKKKTVSVEIPVEIPVEILSAIAANPADAAANAAICSAIAEASEILTEGRFSPGKGIPPSGPIDASSIVERAKKKVERRVKATGTARKRRERKKDIIWGMMQQRGDVTFEQLATVIPPSAMKLIDAVMNPVEQRHTSVTLEQFVSIVLPFYSTWSCTYPIHVHHRQRRFMSRRKYA